VFAARPIQTNALTKVADLAKRLKQPWTDTPKVSGPEVNVAKALEADRAHYRTGCHTFHDYRVQPDAFRHLARLPSVGETMHGIISGRYALYELVPATLARISPATITDLYLATLSFSERNATDLLRLIDDGHVQKVTLIVSHYFKAQNESIYNSLVPPLLSRGHRCLAMRTHCKITLMETSVGEKYTVESSANLQSCKNIEQFSLTSDDALHDFHRGWMEELFK